ncbi:MAG: hypothetical protein PHN80_05155 [Hespellia sp.]|nr:hypothetical protein [Hespellia sp.]
MESIIGAVTIGEGVSPLAKSNLEVFHHENVVAIPLSPPIPIPVLLIQKKSVKKNDALELLIHDLTK